MFKSLLLYAAFGTPLTVSAADTIWWRTSGAAVLQTMNHCSLYSFDKTQAVIFTWRADGSETIAFQDDRFHFAADTHFTVGLRIDDNYLTGDLIGDGADNILTVVLETPIDTLLPSATEVQIKAANGTLDYDVIVPLNHTKMSALLKAVSKCRAVLKH